MINLQLARAYLSATNPAAVDRTWRLVMDEAAKTKKGPTLARWLNGVWWSPAKTAPMKTSEDI
jgi:hypothetical protein